MRRVLKYFLPLILAFVDANIFKYRNQTLKLAKEYLLAIEVR